VLLILAALISLALFFDEGLTHRVRRQGPRARSDASAVPKAHVETNEETPLGANPEEHTEISSLDIPPDSPTYRAVRHREERARRDVARVHHQPGGRAG
jgi:hypothetical protein